MSGFDVSILLRLIDNLTAPSKRAAQSYNQLAQSVTRSSASIRSASSNAAAGVASIGTAAARSQKQVTGLFGTMRNGQRNGRGGGMILGGNNDLFKAMGGWMALRGGLNAAEEVQAAENKFKALVDNVTNDQMSAIREQLRSRMMRSGHTYDTLIGAAGDAAQIVGSANMAGDIAEAASKLALIDTDGKDVAYFSETLAAILGPQGTVKQLGELADILAQQQKLGAATAGGTIEAYKNVVGSQGIYGFEMNDMLTSIGLIKNRAPALQDSQIGNMAKYGIRTIANPVQAMQKNIEAAGLTQDSFRTDGKFDLGKTHKLFWEMRQSEEGMKKFQKLFAGRNVLASEFWNNLTQLDPEKFADYQKKMTGSRGALDAADEQRIEGIVGVMNRLRGIVFELSLTLGKILTPAISLFTSFLETAVMPITRMIEQFTQAHSTIAGGIGVWLGLVGALAALSLFSTKAGVAAGFLFKLPWSVLGGALSGFISSIARAAMWIYRFAGVAGLLRAALLVALGPLGWIGAAIAGIALLVSYWRELEALALGFGSALRGTDVGNWMAGAMAWQASSLYQMFSWLSGIAPGIANFIKSIGDGISSIFSLGSSTGSEGDGAWSWFEAGEAAGKRFLSVIESIKAGIDAVKGFFGMGGVPAPGVPGAVTGTGNDAVNKAANGVGSVRGGSSLPAGMAVQQQGTTVQVNQAPPSVNVSVTVNAQTNADPNAIGAAAAGAVGAKVRGALSDAPHSAP